jgi:hypothetical protein
VTLLSEKEGTWQRNWKSATGFDTDARVHPQCVVRASLGSAFGGVTMVYATSPEEAVEWARREARETSERTHRELDRP